LPWRKPGQKDWGNDLKKEESENGECSLSIPHHKASSGRKKAGKSTFGQKGTGRSGLVKARDPPASVG